MIWMIKRPIFSKVPKIATNLGILAFLSAFANLNRLTLPSMKPKT